MARTDDLTAITSHLESIAESLTRIAELMEFQTEILRLEAVRNGHNVPVVPK